MFGSFTEDARQVIVRAHDEAHRLGHPFLGGEHLLYGLAGAAGPTGQLLRESGVSAERVEAEFVRLVRGRGFADDGVSDPLDREALGAIGIDLDAVRERIEAAFGPNALAAPAPVRHRWRPLGRRRGRRPRNRGHLPFTRRAKGCLDRSLQEARALHSDRLDVEHLALALLAQDSGLPPLILSGLGVSTTRLRTEILNRYRQAD
jgi:ATP-dependent Clp protease ATP-binding subunit ClpA